MRIIREMDDHEKFPAIKRCQCVSCPFWRAGLRDQTNGDGVENIRDNTAGLRELFKIDPSGASELVILPMLSYHPFWVAGLPLIVCC